MRILYVAKHNSGGNDDEGSVAHALEQLGHTVVRAGEDDSKLIRSASPDADLLLFHKWNDLECLRRVECPKVFWYFDLVDFPGDPTLEARCRTRKNWMAQFMPAVDLGFCTDGDWVERVKSWNMKDKDKLVWLTQGADERGIGPGRSNRSLGNIPILFTGIGRGGGIRRESFVSDMRNRYGSKFVHVEKGCHGRNMADLIAAALVVVAPDSPVTDRYWSNRIYNVLGFGGFLLHPYTQGLAEDFGEGDLTMYVGRESLHSNIRHYLGDADEREMLSRAGYEQVKAHHLYRHRVVSLLDTVKERLGIE